MKSPLEGLSPSGAPSYSRSMLKTLVAQPLMASMLSDGRPTRGSYTYHACPNTDHRQRAAPRASALTTPQATTTVSAVQSEQPLA
jgi:hypothetical protein